MAQYSCDGVAVKPAICDGLWAIRRDGSFLGTLAPYIMYGLRTSDSVWVSWTVHGAPDPTGAQYTGGAITLDTIYAQK